MLSWQLFGAAIDRCVGLWGVAPVATLTKGKTCVMKKVKTTCILTCENNGASNQTRTDDPRFTRAVLYQLSYAGLRVSAQLLYGDTLRFASVTADFSMDSLGGSPPLDALHDQ